MEIRLVTLYIFILLVLVYSFVKRVNKFPYIRKNSTNAEFLEALDKLYIKNISYEIFILIIYTMCYFLLFLFLRISNLGKTFTVSHITLYSITGYSIFNVIIFLCCIGYYISIINTLFYPTIIKLHYYFYQYDWYENIIDNMNMNFSIIIDKIQYFKDNILFSLDEEWVNSYWNLDISHNAAEEEIIAVKNKRDRQLKWLQIIKQNKLLFLLAKLFMGFFWFLSKYSQLMYYILYVLVLFLLFHETYHGTIFYTYYALLYYFLILWLKKLRYFYVIKDPIDHSITRYLYKNDIPYDTIRKLLVRYDLKDIISRLGEDTRDVLQYKNELIPYILSDFVNRNQRYPLVNESNKCISSKKKRKIHLLGLTLIMFCYIIMNSKYIMTILTIKLNPGIFFIPLVILLYRLNSNITYKSNILNEYGDNTWIEHKKYKHLFRIIFFTTLFAILYITLRNKVTIFPEEIIFQWGNYVKIEERFSLEEKQQYILSYFDAIKQILSLTEIQYTALLHRIKQEIILYEGMTMEMIRTAINDIINTWDPSNKLSDALKKKHFLSIITKIVLWIKNLWS